jgi:drug/metabolite transporter (DMT)-like permease
MKNQKLAYIFGCLAVLFWSTVATAFKFTLKYITPLQLLFYSSVFSCIVLFILIIFTKKLEKLKKVGSLKKTVLMGLINPALYYLLLFKAYDLLTAQEAQAINYTWAITLVLLSIPILGQKINKKEIFTIFISYSGLFIIATRGDVTGFRFTNGAGVVLALLSTILWALYWIFNSKSKTDPVIELFYNFLFGSLFILPVILLFSSFQIPLKGLMGTIYVGVFEMGLTFVFWYYAMKLTVKTSRISNLIFLSPFLSLIFINFFVGEKILFSTIAGLFLIISGIILQKKFENKV